MTLKLQRYVAQHMRGNNYAHKYCYDGGLGSAEGS